MSQAAQASDARDVRWKWALLALAAVASLVTIFDWADVLGVGARPWYGWWDANIRIVGPYTVAIAQPRPDGASSRAGLRDGDLIDLRHQDLNARFAAVYQPLSTDATSLEIQRDSSTRLVSVLPSTVWEGASLWKFPALISQPIASVWFIICAILLASRRWWQRDARVLALVLLCLTGTLLNPTNSVVPDARVGLLLLVFSRACVATASLLLVRLSARFGRQTLWRTNLERFAYAVIALGFVADLAVAIGLLTLWIDPLPYAFRISVLRGGLDLTGLLIIAATATAAVSSTESVDRPRAGWLLLPLPIALVTSAAFAAGVPLMPSWFASVTVAGAGVIMWLFGSMIVMYALLKRRVLDFEFVLGRTLVVATVSLVVVAAFAVLEWILGTVLAGVSHATGLIANGALALVLGLSLNPIHKRIDALVEAVLFRQRHENERALLDFSKEAAYVTEADALLDRAIEKIERHADARGAALLINGDGAYAAARCFGESVSTQVQENDAAILALKAWHKPLDPHQYETALQCALAFPMLARGRMLGVLLLGERAGGEAYAPDEIEALSQFAHGVGSGLDALLSRSRSNGESVLEAVRTLSHDVRSLCDSVVSELRIARNNNPGQPG